MYNCMGDGVRMVGGGGVGGDRDYYSVCLCPYNMLIQLKFHTVPDPFSGVVILVAEMLSNTTVVYAPMVLALYSSVVSKE